VNVAKETKSATKIFEKFDGKKGGRVQTDLFGTQTLVRAAGCD